VSIHQAVGGEQLWDACDGKCVARGADCKGSCLEGMCKLDGKCQPITSSLPLEIFEIGNTSIPISNISIPTNMSSSSSSLCDFLHCKEGGGCFPLLDEHFAPIRRECQGECIALNATCSGSCEVGQCIEDGECRPCKNIICPHPKFCHQDGKCLETVQLYEKANSTSIKSCEGECVPLNQTCESGCGLPWQCQQDNSCVSIHQAVGGEQLWDACDGKCVARGADCKGSCLEGMCKLDGKCQPMMEDGKKVRWECDGQCTNISTLCKEGCGGGGRCLEGKQCLALGEGRGECGGLCHPPHLPCNSGCATGHCLKGTSCLPLGEGGKQVRSECDGQCSPREIPCKGKCPPDMCEEGGRCLELLDKQYKVVRKECNGKCQTQNATCTAETNKLASSAVAEEIADEDYDSATD